MAMIAASITSGCNIAAGSYPYAQIFQLHATEEEVITAVSKVKAENPAYAVPKAVNLPEGRSGLDDHWYQIYFYYPAENQLVYTWARRDPEDSTCTFALVSINQGLQPGNWKDLNKDYGYIDSKIQTAIFEERILSKIRKSLNE